ncbi:serine/threonine-protein kinase [Streptomyces sp. ME19-01-6]|uniref:serine/threonine-protein kinase n=1 Tax=Streptomyces sp. ME19-01-6 TaxID=3028686 RepID=UPI0029AF10EE|nr:serine/threonine-protein kinase [Streptomyces sp. ME19-01-6]MDX3227423.1 serine/threonine-protein kinase [Streptomyces sp. ME19-01-6]
MDSFGGSGGRLLAGRYQLVSRLGRGGMGTVWRAVDTLLGRDVAVKELHLDEGLDGMSALDVQQQHERTLREARTVAQIKHPNVIVLHDVVEEDGRPWIVMELVDGRSLADRLAAEGPVGPGEAARVGVALLDALRVAHARGVLHRDIKPANVLMEAGTRRVVLTDFGIAQVTGSTTITETGTFVGSPEYTAPERMSGRRTGPESDLWSLGVLLCTLVSGESPFRRDSLGGVLHAVVFDEVRAPEAAGALAPVIEGLLQRDPDLRLPGDEAARMLRMCLEPGDTPEIPLEYTPTQPAVPVATGHGAGYGATGYGAAGYGPATPPAASVAPEPPTPVAPAPRRGGPRRRTALMAAVAVVALAGLGAGVAALALDRGDGDTAQEGRGGATATATTAPGKKPSGKASPTPSTTAVPDGYELVHDPKGFTIAVPKGYSREDKPPRVYYNSPGMEFRIGIHVQEQDPKGPLRLSREADARGPQNYPGYRGGQVIATDRKGQPAALWAFIWNGSADDGGSRQTYDLTWNEAGKMYDVWVSAPVGRKSEGKQYFDTAVSSFLPSAGQN